MTNRNERTSKRVAKIAGLILSMKWPRSARVMTYLPKRTSKVVHITFGDIRALAASALTQAPNKGESGQVRKALRGQLGTHRRKAKP
jgi:hypothetical protein